MYTILEKLDNIERALHRYDETRQVSFDTVPYRAAAGNLGFSTADYFNITVQNLTLNFCRLLWTGQHVRKTVSFSFNDLNLDFSHHNEPQFRVNAIRKKDDNRCTATFNIDIPTVPSPDQMDNPDLPDIVNATKLILSKIEYYIRELQKKQDDYHECYVCLQ
jgi:hypothetical protein